MSQEKKIGIVGGGQLGRMLACAAKKLGFKVIVLDPTPQSPAGQVADKQIVGSFKDKESIFELSKEADVITFEIESADYEALKEISKEKIVHPSPDTLRIIKDKLLQKETLRENDIPIADFKSIESEDDIEHIVNTFGLPFLIKARFDAYDGRGNALVESVEDIPKALEKLQGRRLYAEKFIPFKKELSVVAARDTLNNVKTYPTVETIHRNNICHTVISPARITPEVDTKARDLAARVMNLLDGVGVFGIEMFLGEEDEVYINEIAPRVHNSGHHTIEANETSQFEQHVRAVTGLSLGGTHMVKPSAVMVNILGERDGVANPVGVDECSICEDTFIHIYGKNETRKERKMGHITVIGDDVEKVLEKALEIRNRISI